MHAGMAVSGTRAARRSWRLTDPGRGMLPRAWASGLGLVLLCLQLAATKRSIVDSSGSVPSLHVVDGIPRRRILSSNFATADKLVVATVQSEGTAAQIRGYRFWADSTNDQGGISLGSSRLKVDLRVYDDLGNASLREELYQQIAAHGDVDAIFTPNTASLNNSYDVRAPISRFFFEPNTQGSSPCWSLLTPQLNATFPPCRPRKLGTC